MVVFLDKYAVYINDTAFDPNTVAFEVYLLPRQFITSLDVDAVVVTSLMQAGRFDAKTAELVIPVAASGDEQLPVIAVCNVFFLLGSIILSVSTLL